MIILSHRGYWNHSVPSNSIEAIYTSLENGFGFESDMRDYRGNLVISHNIADESSPPAESVFQYLNKFHDQYCFAINIKADGLKDQLIELLKKYQITNYFTFDMSVPQMIEYREMGITYFTRQSEYERLPVLYENSAGVWVDAFEDNSWITEKLLAEHIANGKKICLVSPDLHHKDHMYFWNRLKKYSLDFSKIMLCTDMPKQAKDFFNL